MRGCIRGAALPHYARPFMECKVRAFQGHVIQILSAMKVERDSDNSSCRTRNGNGTPVAWGRYPD